MFLAIIYLQTVLTIIVITKQDEVGHPKALNLTFEYVKKFGGYTYLIYEDINPKNETDEHFNSILEALKIFRVFSKIINYYLFVINLMEYKI